MDSVHAGPIFEVNAALRKYLLHGIDELVHKRIELIGRRACLAYTQVERIVKILFVVGSGVEVHGQEILRWHAGAGRVQLQLADRDRGSVCSEIAEAEDA